MTNRIRLMHHDPAWSQEFQQTRSSILMACEGWVVAIDHVGSTAIEGLIAQPVIDAVAVVDDARGIAVSTQCIEGLNYRKLETPDWAEGTVHLVKSRSGEPTHRVLLMLANDPLRKQLNDVTDWIRQNPEGQLRFETAKVHQWRMRDGEPQGYARSKGIFFAHVLEQLGHS